MKLTSDEITYLLDGVNRDIYHVQDYRATHKFLQEPVPEAVQEALVSLIELKCKLETERCLGAGSSDTSTSIAVSRKPARGGRSVPVSTSPA